MKMVAAILYQAGESNGNYFLWPWISPIRLESLEKCAVIPPENPTNTRVVLDQDTDSVNEDATAGAVTSDASR